MQHWRYLGPEWTQEAYRRLRAYEQVPARD